MRKLSPRISNAHSKLLLAGVSRAVLDIPIKFNEELLIINVLSKLCDPFMKTVLILCSSAELTTSSRSLSSLANMPIS